MVMNEEVYSRRCDDMSGVERNMLYSDDDDDVYSIDDGEEWRI